MSGDPLYIPGVKGPVRHFEFSGNNGRVSDHVTALFDHDMPTSQGMLPILFRERLVEGSEEEPSDLTQAFP